MNKVLYYQEELSGLLELQMGGIIYMTGVIFFKVNFRDVPDIRLAEYRISGSSKEKIVISRAIATSFIYM